MQFLDSKPCRNRSRFASVALWGVWLKPTSGTEVVEAKVGAHRGLQHLMRFVFYVFFWVKFRRSLGKCHHMVYYTVLADMFPELRIRWFAGPQGQSWDASGFSTFPSRCAEEANSWGSAVRISGWCKMQPVMEGWCSETQWADLPGMRRRFAKFFLVQMTRMRRFS